MGFPMRICVFIFPSMVDYVFFFFGFHILMWDWFLISRFLKFVGHTNCLLTEDLPSHWYWMRIPIFLATDVIALFVLF